MRGFCIVGSIVQGVGAGYWRLGVWDHTDVHLNTGLTFFRHYEAGVKSDRLTGIVTAEVICNKRREKVIVEREYCIVRTEYRLLFTLPTRTPLTPLKGRTQRADTVHCLLFTL